MKSVSEGSAGGSGGAGPSWTRHTDDEGTWILNHFNAPCDRTGSSAGSWLVFHMDVTSQSHTAGVIHDISITITRDDVNFLLVATLLTPAQASNSESVDR